MNKYYIVDGQILDQEGLRNIADDLGCKFEKIGQVITFLEAQGFEIKRFE